MEGHGMESNAMQCATQRDVEERAAPRVVAETEDDGDGVLVQMSSSLVSSRSEALRDVWMTGYLRCGGLSAAAATMKRPVQAGLTRLGR